MFWYLVPVVSAAVGFFVASRYYKYSDKTPSATLVKYEKDGSHKYYLRVNYVFNDREYITYILYSKHRAAKYWEASLPNGDVIKFHPGAFPSIPVGVLGVDHVVLTPGVGNPTLNVEYIPGPDEPISP